MKVKGTPVKYDMYGDKPCYHVELFEDELRLIDRALHIFHETRLFGALYYDEFSEDDRRRFDDGWFELTFALCRIEDGNTEPTGLVVSDDE